MWQYKLPLEQKTKKCLNKNVLNQIDRLHIPLYVILAPFPKVKGRLSYETTNLEYNIDHLNGVFGEIFNIILKYNVTPNNDKSWVIIEIIEQYI